MKINKLIDGSSGVCPLGPSNKVKSAVRKAVKRINSGSCIGMDALKKLFESKFRLSSEKVLFANSVNELIYFIPDVLKPKRVLVVGPALDIYEDAARSAGAEISYRAATDTDGFVFDMSCLQKDIRNIDLVFLANPNRISGKMIPSKTIGEAINMMPPGSPHFVIDESLTEFAGNDNCCDDMLNKGNFTLLRTTAYFYGMPGLELAHAVSSPDRIRLYNKEKHWDINLLSIEAAKIAYKDSTYSKASRQYMLFEKKMMMRMLRKIEWIKAYDSDIHILLMKIDKNPDEVSQKLRGAGLDIRDCADIKGLDRSFFRIAIMKHEHNLKLISTLNSL